MVEPFVEPLEFKGKWKGFEELAIANYSSTPDEAWRVRAAWGNLVQKNMHGESFRSGVLSVRFSEGYQIPEEVVEKLTLTKLHPIVPDARPMVVTTDDPLCRYPSLTGGKGSSLAQLTLISTEIRKVIA